jgi:HSP20 family protein
MGNKVEVLPRDGALHRWFTDWLDFPELFRPFEGMRPMTEDRIRVEEELKDDTLVVRAEVPGIDPDKDAEIYVSDGMLHLRVERRQEIEEEDKGRIRSEFRYGSFTRTVAMPKGATPGDVKATYKDGILEVVVPVVMTPPEAKRIAVTRG